MAGERFNKSVIQVEDGITNFTIQLWDGPDFGKPAGSPVDTPGAWYDDGGAHDVLQRIGRRFGLPGAIDSTDGFHKYQISLDAGGTASAGNGTSAFAPGNSDDMITIWVDDVMQVGPLPRTSFDFHSPPNPAPEEINIGRILGPSPPDSETHHNFWEFKTGFITPELAADFNTSNNVDGTDLSSWATGFSKTGTAVKSDGDADDDMDVDGNDFITWQRQFNSSVLAQGAVVNVPEPSAAVLLRLALVLACTPRNRIIESTAVKCHPGKLRL